MSKFLMRLIQSRADIAFGRFLENPNDDNRARYHEAQELLIEAIKEETRRQVEKEFCE